MVELTPEIGLSGHDCWADGRLGDYANSAVMLHDYFLIKELAGLDSQWLPGATVPVQVVG